MPKLTTNFVLTILGLLVVIIATVAFLWGGGPRSGVSGKSQSAAVATNLLTTSDFAILAGTGITNTGVTTVTGDVGSYPTLTQTGFGPGADSVTITGTNHFGDATTQNAKTDLVTAYDALAAQTPDFTISADLGGQTLTPGVYNSASTIGITGTVILDGGGDPNAVFVFQAGSAITTASASSVSLTGGTQACNVFWQIGSDATLGTNSTFKGTLIALSSITVTTGVTVDGRVLARNGAVTLDTNGIVVPGCITSPTLRVIKHMVNDDGGVSAASAWTLSVTSSNGGSGTGSAAGAASPGTTYTLQEGKAYSVAESAGPSGYSASASSGCTIASASSGTTYTCTITNDDTAPVPAPAVSSGGSGGADAKTVPIIAVTKIPTPLALPTGPGLVTYIYTLTNIGPVPIAWVSVKDDMCSPAMYISGDKNTDSKLDMDEAWVYRCMQTVSTTTTNIVTAHGQAGGWDTYDTAPATVVVGESTLPPLIAVVKIPSRLTPFPFGGGNVTYTYTVRNPGVVAMHDVTLSDDKCAPAAFVSGDVNGNSLLEPSEVWTYNCTSYISVSTRNTATAKGVANGLTAIDYAFANVPVSVPSLPGTGLPPEHGAQTR